MSERLRFVTSSDAIVEPSPWGPHEWLSRPGLTDAMRRGASALVPRLHAAGRIDGVLGLGGGGGTAVITDAHAAVGVPKRMVSTLASGNTAPYVDVSDITLMPSVVDIAGLNPLSRRILANAAGAVPEHPLLAATMFGVNVVKGTFASGAPMMAFRTACG